MTSNAKRLGIRAAEWEDRFAATRTDVAWLEEEGREIIRLLRAEILAMERGKVPTENGGRLEVPYLSQWGEGADTRRSDCGPAAVASIIHALTAHRPTVDQVADACDQAIAGYTTAAQLARGAAKFGVKLVYRRPLVTGGMIEHVLRDGWPSIALINYKTLREETNHLGGIVRNQDQNFSAGHWVCFVGFEDARGVYVHDPNFWGAEAAKGAYRWIPWEAWTKALATPAQGNSYGNQGLVVEGLIA